MLLYLKFERLRSATATVHSMSTTKVYNWKYQERVKELEWIDGRFVQGNKITRKHILFRGI